MKFYDYNGAAHHTPLTAAAANSKILIKRYKSKVRGRKSQAFPAENIQSTAVSLRDLSQTFEIMADELDAQEDLILSILECSGEEDGRE